MDLQKLRYDIPAGLVVFLVALPLCLGIALASGAPPMSGILSGIIGGTVVALLSGSHTSVSGPAAGLSAIVATAILELGSFNTFLLAVVLAGIMQICLGLVKAGRLTTFFPNNIIKGLLAAIGIILIMKQIPHAFGYDPDVEGDFSFFQNDGNNTFTELFEALNHIDFGATIISISSLLILIIWAKSPLAKISWLPAPLIVVIWGVALNELFKANAWGLDLKPEHLVALPTNGISRVFTSADAVQITNLYSEWFKLHGWGWGLKLEQFITLPTGRMNTMFTFPDITQISNLHVWKTAFIIACVASLETLLNIEATDKLDPERRHTPPDRELWVQGTGNIISGLIGGLPMTSVVVRTSANINAGGKTRFAALLHGVLLAICVLAIPNLLNLIPLSCLAAILLYTGYKLANPALFIEKYKKGWNRFIPFMACIIAIVLTDLLIGIIIGLGIGILFVLKENLFAPFVLNKEKVYKGEILRLQLDKHVTFLNKTAFAKTLAQIPNGSKVVLDASETESIDLDIIYLIEDYLLTKAKERNVELHLLGFSSYGLQDSSPFTAVATKDVQSSINPEEALSILKDGNSRFIHNLQVHRDLLTQVNVTADGQFPIAAIVSCIDSRTSAELIFDLGLGDVFSIRIAGNFVNEDILGSLEFSCKVAGAKLIVVLGHSNCGAIKAACDGGVDLGNLTAMLHKIKPAVDAEFTTLKDRNSKNYRFVANVAQKNVEVNVQNIVTQSPVLREMIENGEIGIIGAMYDVETGVVDFYEHTYVRAVSKA